MLWSSGHRMGRNPKTLTQDAYPRRLPKTLAQDACARLDPGAPCFTVRLGVGRAPRGQWRDRRPPRRGGRGRVEPAFPCGQKKRPDRGCDGGAFWFCEPRGWSKATPSSARPFNCWVAQAIRMLAPGFALVRMQDSTYSYLGRLNLCIANGINYMARNRCERREAALTKLEIYKKAHPDEAVPASLLTYFDEKGVRRYTLCGHDTQKSSVRAGKRYITSIERARCNELRLRLAMDLVPMISFEWDIVGDKVRRLDPQKLELSATGGSYAHFGAVLNAVHPDDRARFHADIQRALTEPEVDFESEVRVSNPDGSVRWYYEQGKVERDSKGRPLRLIGVAVDVTAQKIDNIP